MADVRYLQNDARELTRAKGITLYVKHIQTLLKSGNGDDCPHMARAGRLIYWSEAAKHTKMVDMYDVRETQTTEGM